MRLHVAFHPTLLATGALWEPQVAGGRLLPVPADRPQVCMVVDVMRASTSLLTLVERGAGPIYIASSVSSARESPYHRDGAVMAGEEEGLAPKGFHYGNSPVELSRAPLEGRPVVFVTTNGTAAIRSVQHLGPVMVGAMRNAAAVAKEALRSAEEQSTDVTIVCAGREGGFGIDDAHCAGYLASRLLELTQCDLTDGAAAALSLYRADTNTLGVFTRSAAGQNVTRIGLGPDIAYCAERDQTTVVPRLGQQLQILGERTSYVTQK